MFMNKLCKLLTIMLGILIIILSTSCNILTENNQSSLSLNSTIIKDGTENEEDNLHDAIKSLHKTEPLSDYIVFELAKIPDIVQNQKGIQAQGVEKVILDVKQVDSLLILLIGDFVSTDNDTYPGMINCFELSIAISDGINIGEICKAPAEFNGVEQGGYWIYTERLSDYINIYKFEENYIVVFRSFDCDDVSHAAFYAIKQGVMYPMLMGDYSAVGGEPLAVVTKLSENISVDYNKCSIKDIDNGIMYIFDFDLIDDSFIDSHYVVVPFANSIW